MFVGLPSFADNETKCIVTCKDARFPAKSTFKALSSQTPFPKNGESNLNCYDPELTCVGGQICPAKIEIEWVELVNKTDKAVKKLTGRCADVPTLGKVFRAPMKSGLLWGEGKFVVSDEDKTTYFYKAAAGE